MVGAGAGASATAGAGAGARGFGHIPGQWDADWAILLATARFGPGTPTRAATNRDVTVVALPVALGASLPP